ncbi:coproporphyrinogen dehydrogenase HemZ [Anaerofustis sp.]|uniref:coproporphyrinogen dehydrogenase HemZ n=1 Tax=Anaerofustis sp. TaxID=1872517 RepID=UPI0025C660B0|nr:coproporphyrinogen dehydrogenase HemZ [Anaerofustis sp.]
MNITTDNNIKEIHVREILQMFYPDKYKNIKIKLYLQGNFIYLEYKEKTYKERVTLSLKNTTKRLVYKVLQKETGKSFPYGVLTGVKPINILNLYSNETIEEVKKVLSQNYLMYDEKINLLLETKKNQEKLINDKLASLYIHIPFCPKRCSYCSFPSKILNETSKELDIYTDCLIKEIKSLKNIIKEKNIFLDSIYIGGGTPGILKESNLDKLLSNINKYINIDTEFTFELGRADLLTKEKLEILKKQRVTRVCLNPQSMTDEVLINCNRNIKTKDFTEGIKLIKKYGFIINSDLIMGLNDDIESFFEEVNKLVNMDIDNITIHTLALKRGSALDTIKFENEDFQNTQKRCFQLLKNKGYNPYYLYKQKQSLCMGENVGFSKQEKECIYNIKTMKDKSTILAIGAGGAGKIYNKSQDKTYRINTTKDTNIYMKNIDSIIKEKEKEYSMYI